MACYARFQPESWETALSWLGLEPGRRLLPFPSACFYDINKYMAKSIRDSKKSKPKMGRPSTTGPGQPQVVRMHDQQIAAIDAWIVMHNEEISRPEAIRRLVELGLKAKPAKT